MLRLRALTRQERERAEGTAVSVEAAIFEYYAHDEDIDSEIEHKGSQEESAHVFRDDDSSTVDSDSDSGSQLLASDVAPKKSKGHAHAFQLELSDLRIRTGELVAVIGRVGAGKVRCAERVCASHH